VLTTTTDFTFDAGVGFVVTPLNLTVNGLAAPTDFLGFFNADPAIGGGVAILASGTDIFGYASGPQIYGGTESSPTLSATGSPIMLADASATTPTIGQYSLTIKDLSIVETPEPSVTILRSSACWPLDRRYYGSSQTLASALTNRRTSH
jgi:hypothetical protein